MPSQQYSMLHLVLILVLVEHTLGDTASCQQAVFRGVLILVLVEHTLGVATGYFTIEIKVLILVLVEHTLGGR